MRMPTVRSGIVAFSLALLPACGGSGGGGGPVPTPPVIANWYVNALTGSNANAGTFQAPFKSITHALSVVQASQTIYAAPGLYDAANGETFPLEIPQSVTLLGDESNRGNGPGSSDTLIRGGGPLPPPYSSVNLAAVLPRSGVVIAGFWIHDDAPLAMGNPYGVALPDPGVTLRNNTIRDAITGGVFVFNNAGAHTIASNVLFGSLTGLYFASGGVGSRVEFNVITENTYGVVYDAAGGDLGGGAAASAGGNSIFCNTTNDVRAAIAVTVDAQNNFWDHVPPTLGTGSEDLYNAAASNYVVTGAALASSPCP